ncbi:ester cyclase [Nonomuraea rhodomycinica]|uniref:Ester cyclase n=1 Tax=Nonomuraea rhodomycinica TaxID=1712872 RepID=A0A7Y6MEJ2_9ACTN|nr:ester cyclase [Nonomuraea rhodomycinica]NUW44987.1 ester cyclase [Nonomuraea rhodomycinica]
MRSRNLVRTAVVRTAVVRTAVVRTVLARAVVVAVAASLAGGVATAAHAHDNGRHHGPHAWPQRLIDRSPDLIRPKRITVDRSIGDKRAAQEVHLAQKLYTFWNTGRQKYLDAAVSPRFKDNTLPGGRPQGPAGPAFASKNFRAAVPDLTCELSDLLVTGDKITARLVFRGHFTGTFGGVQGKGQRVEFNAIDIQHVGTDKIIEDWHIEDNATLLSQLGVNG